jgi:hypothetical protein
VRPFQLRDDYAKVLLLITVEASGSTSEKEEMAKLNRRILDVQTEKTVKRT